MVDGDADTGPIDAFSAALRNGATVERALDVASVSAGVKRFVTTTMGIAQSRSAHRIAAAFSFGREGIIPEMFERLVTRLADLDPRRWSTFRYYLERHIERDGEKHAPAAREPVSRLCGSDSTVRAEADAAACACLAARGALWDDVRRELRSVS